jgi:hypothetical protein
MSRMLYDFRRDLLEGVLPGVGVGSKTILELTDWLYTRNAGGDVVYNRERSREGLFSPEFFQSLNHFFHIDPSE